MRRGALTIRTCYMDRTVLMMRMLEVLVKFQTIVESFLIAIGTLPLKHRHLVIQIFTRLLICHVAAIDDDLIEIVLKALEDGILRLLITLEVVALPELFNGYFLLTA